MRGCSVLISYHWRVNEKWAWGQRIIVDDTGTWFRIVQSTTDKFLAILNWFSQFFVGSPPYPQ